MPGQFRCVYMNSLYKILCKRRCSVYAKGQNGEKNGMQARARVHTAKGVKGAGYVGCGRRPTLPCSGMPMCRVVCAQLCNAQTLKQVARFGTDLCTRWECDRYFKGGGKRVVLASKTKRQDRTKRYGSLKRHSTALRLAFARGAHHRWVPIRQFAAENARVYRQKSPEVLRATTTLHKALDTECIKVGWGRLRREQKKVNQKR